jgi:hypothetical protein
MNNSKPPVPWQDEIDHFVGAAGIGMNGEYSVKEFLKKYPAAVNAKSRWDETALAAAARGDCVGTIRILMEYGADAGAKDGLGRTALTFARHTCRDIIVSWPETLKQRAAAQEAEQRAKFLKDTDFQRGLDHAILAPRVLKIRRPRP